MLINNHIIMGKKNMANIQQQYCYYRARSSYNKYIIIITTIRRRLDRNFTLYIIISR